MYPSIFCSLAVFDSMVVFSGITTAAGAGSAGAWGGGVAVVVQAARSSSAAKRFMNKNLVTRRREDAKKSRLSFASSRLRVSLARDDLHTLHVGPKCRRHPHRPILILVVLEDGHDSAADGQAGTVEGVNVARLLLRCAVADVGAPGLEVEEVRAGADLAIGLLPRQPHFQVVGLGRGEAHVAGGEGDDAVVQPERLQHGLGVGGQLLVLRP